jgi:hypothetical protein
VLLHEASIIATKERTEMKMIEFFIARNCRWRRGTFNHKAPWAVKRAGIVDDKFSTGRSHPVLKCDSGAILWSGPDQLNLESGVPNFPRREVVGYIPLMWSGGGGAGSWYGAVVSAGTRKGSTSDWLAQESSAITATESAETRTIDFFMARTVVDAGGNSNCRAPQTVKRCVLIKIGPPSFPARAGGSIYRSTNWENDIARRTVPQDFFWAVFRQSWLPLLPIQIFDSEISS